MPSAAWTSIAPSARISSSVVIPPAAVISCRVGLCKPEPAIYAHLLKRYALAASETVFIDDLDVNLAAAATFGIKTIKFEDPPQCARALQALGVAGT